MTLKKYTIALEGLLSHENIIFKLICSVSERTKNRSYSYELTTDISNANIYINDIKNKNTDEIITNNHLNVWISDSKEDISNSISRPLIATRVLHTIDNLIKTNELENKAASSETTAIVNNKEVEAKNTEEVDKNSIPPMEFTISEEEASELAIVHDEVLENPANKEEKEAVTNNIELTLIKNEKAPVISKTDIPHVLVVDDSQSVRKQLELELDLFNVKVDYADCAAKAFSLLKENTYDIALLDVVLPDKDGFLICKHIKSTVKQTIVIMLTGKATQADKIKGSLAGCNDYLIKPVGRATFQNAVKNYMSLKNINTAIEA